MNPPDSPQPTGKPDVPSIPTSSPQGPAGNPRYRRAKKWFVTFLIIWLAVLPVTAIGQLVVHFMYTPPVPICTGTDFSGFAQGADYCTPPPTAADTAIKIVNIISALGGLYFFVGWVPVLITGLRMESAKRQS